MTNTFGQFWESITGGTDDFDPDTLTDTELAAIRAKVTSGELPEGFVETDPETALNRLNRSELMGRFISYRRRLGQYSVRAYLPVLDNDRSQEPPTPIKRTDKAWVPLTPGHWISSSRIDPAGVAAIAAHAEASIRNHVRTAVGLHGAMLVEKGIATPEQVRDLVVAEAHAAYDDLARTSAESAAVTTAAD